MAPESGGALSAAQAPARRASLPAPDHQQSAVPEAIRAKPKKPRERRPISRGDRDCLNLIDYYERRHAPGRNHPGQKDLREKLGDISNGCLGNRIYNLKAWELLDVKQGGDGKASLYAVTAAGKRFLETGELSGELKSSKASSIQPEMKSLGGENGELKRPNFGSSGFKTSNPSSSEIGTSSETPQHHRDRKNADDAAGVRADTEVSGNAESAKTKPSPGFIRAVEAEFGRKLPPSDLAWCAALENRGLAEKTVCDGIAVGSFRKLRANVNGGLSVPIRSLRYFESCIEEAAAGAFPDGYAANARRRLRQHAQEAAPRKEAVKANSATRAESELAKAAST